MSQSTESPKHLGALGFIFNCVCVGGGVHESRCSWKPEEGALKLEL